MVHGVRLGNGAARWYANRYVQTTLLQSSAQAVDPFDPAANYSNVSVLYHVDRLLSLGETGLPYQLDPDDLSTTGVYDFDGCLNGWMTAQPKIDPLTGQLLFFGYAVTPPYLT